MNPLKLTSVDLEPLSALSNIIKLIFEAYSDEDKNWNEYDLLLDTQSNSAIPHENFDNKFFKTDYSRASQKFNLQTVNLNKFRIYGENNGSEWFAYYEDGSNDCWEGLDEDNFVEIDELILEVFSTKNLSRIVSEVYDHQFS